MLMWHSTDCSPVHRHLNAVGVLPDAQVRQKCDLPGRFKALHHMARFQQVSKNIQNK
jgi:hypothetical protein